MLNTLSLFFCSTYSNYTLLWTIHLEYYQPEIKAGLEYENKPKKNVLQANK